MKRRRMEFIYTTLMYMITTIISGTAAIFILRPKGKIDLDFLGGAVWDVILGTIIPLLIVSVMASVVLKMMGLGTNSFEFKKTSYYDSLKVSVKFNLVLAAGWAVWLLLAKNVVTDSRYYFVVTLALNVILTSLFSYWLVNHTVNTFYKGRSATLVGVVTTVELAPKIIHEIKHDWTRKLVGLALVDTGSNSNNKETPQEIDGIPVVADTDTFLGWVRGNALDEIFMYVGYDRLYDLTEEMLEIESMGTRIVTSLPMLEEFNAKLSSYENDPTGPVINHEVQYFGSIPMLTLTPEQPRLRKVIVKRCIDIIGALVGCLICLILIILVGIPIIIESPGPMFFAQNRVGKNGRIFKMYKFRSMYKDAEQRKKDLMDQNEVNGLMFKMTDDPRITKVGKFIRKTSLDEFPQFFNVLKGDMSLVGTRPPTVDEYNQYSSYHKRRLSIKPGITGLWQVSGRNEITDFEEVVRLDCRYIDTWDLALDVKILFKTIFGIFTHKGAK